MHTKPKRSPIAIRLDQIDKETARVRKQTQDKSLRDFKSPEAFASFQERQADKLYALNEELAELQRPEDYNEIPLAVVAEELGITLTEILAICRQRLLQLSSEDRPSIASR